MTGCEDHYTEIGVTFFFFLVFAGSKIRHGGEGLDFVALGSSCAKTDTCGKTARCFAGRYQGVKYEIPEMQQTDLNSFCRPRWTCQIWAWTD